MSIQKLLEPIRVGNMTLKNRIVMPPMVTNYASEAGGVTSRLVSYYAARAKGGVGLITMEATNVHPQGKMFSQLGIYDDGLIPGLARLTNELQKHGAKASIQLHHAGRNGDHAFSNTFTLAPSAIPTKILTPYRDLPPVSVSSIPKQMTTRDIQETIQAFGLAARRAKAANFDAVTIHAAHGYLINQFLSPFMNLRKDAYGGSPENRARFLLEIVNEIRKQVGNDLAIITRISADEHVEGGLGIGESIEIAKMLQENGVDAIDSSAAIYESTMYNVPSAGMPLGLNTEDAAQLKRHLRIPVITVGRIPDLEFAARIIEDGKADLVAMGRPLIADPEIIKKTVEGRRDEIIPCIYCNHCHKNISDNQNLSCSVNPQAGREDEYPIAAASKVKHVIVVGAGPSGAEASRVLAARGHKVSLYDAHPDIGGIIFVCVRALPHKGDFKRLIEYYKRQLQSLGVSMNLGKRISVKEILANNPDTVIIATGGEEIVPNIAGRNYSNVSTAIDVLEGRARLGKKVVIIGGGGTGLDLAANLASSGRKVTILEMLEDVCTDIDANLKLFLLELLHKNRAKIICGAKASKITRKGVTYLKDGRKLVEEADSIVFAMGLRRSDKLYDSLVGKVPELYLTGDALQPGMIFEAIRDGSRIGRYV
jgi:2,4-dienoyl-CoA reductase-like NADH-dependent reductase (Old Yellow Enzyme family)/thioredoxin reductase